MTLGGDCGVTIPFATSDEQACGFSDIQQKYIVKQGRYKKRWQRTLARRRNYNEAKRRAARHQRYAVDVRRDAAHKTALRWLVTTVTSCMSSKR